MNSRPPFCTSRANTFSLKHFPHFSVCRYFYQAVLLNARPPLIICIHGVRRFPYYSPKPIYSIPQFTHTQIRDALSLNYLSGPASDTPRSFTSFPRAWCTSRGRWTCWSTTWWRWCWGIGDPEDTSSMGTRRASRTLGLVPTTKAAYWIFKVGVVNQRYGANPSYFIFWGAGMENSPVCRWP